MMRFSYILIVEDKNGKNTDSSLNSVM
jgi:hypothetical protein